MRLINQPEEKQGRHNKEHKQSCEKGVICQCFIKNGTLCFAAYRKKGAEATKHKQDKTYSRYLVNDCCIAELKELNRRKYEETKTQ